eukprot:209749_1
MDYFRSYWNLSIVTLILYTMVTIPIFYNLFQKNQLSAFSVINHERNVFKFVLNECLNNGSKRAADLQYNTLNTAFIITGNISQITKCFASLESHINQWYGKINKTYLMTDLSKNKAFLKFKIKK